MPDLYFVPQGGWGLLENGFNGGLYTEGMSTCRPLVIYSSMQDRAAFMHLDEAKERLENAEKIFEWIGKGSGQVEYTIITYSPQDFACLMMNAIDYNSKIKEVQFIGADTETAGIIIKDDKLLFLKGADMQAYDTKNNAAWSNEPYPLLSDLMDVALKVRNRQLMIKNLSEQCPALAELPEAPFKTASAVSTLSIPAMENPFLNEAQIMSQMQEGYFITE
ncbi:hypothetical protein [Polycladidibacter stylochi]|uniref:hypothetical protein n=1 Tax=Polycladidibacter stylochi TaxID=1807766 RepID=UPI00082E5009|nr:hypothetical protein [Pseudovibrio stylochi]